ncbi:zinc finger MYM-type protein 1-like [Aphis craccivora]|uniref:Zinc finger MYM-type protein 1-like n=1 Tax=Aphis craccivora TaxID=307492 RepID=A0A6G0XY67_APHCR|nr:zinc finger MYM-type protein 1-like [Aphis craccivora]
MSHYKSVDAWMELKTRISKGKSINQLVATIIERKKNHWKNNFINNSLMPFGVQQMSYTLKGNGNFFGIIEILEKFDPIMEEHLRLIKDEELVCII